MVAAIRKPVEKRLYVSQTSHYCHSNVAITLQICNKSRLSAIIIFTSSLLPCYPFSARSATSEWAILSGFRAAPGH
jgi:hypothetical protein